MKANGVFFSLSQEKQGLHGPTLLGRLSALHSTTDKQDKAIFAL
jgi:hypothetical protein